MKKIFQIFIVLFAALLSIPATAATPFSIENIGGSVGLGTADAKATVINIVNWILGILALTAVTLIIVSGFIAATASSEERGARARQIIVGALVGLVIVLLAWAIVTFVAGTAANVTA